MSSDPKRKWQQMSETERQAQFNGLPDLQRRMLGLLILGPVGIIKSGTIIYPGPPAMNAGPCPYCQEQAAQSRVVQEDEGPWPAGEIHIVCFACGYACPRFSDHVEEAVRAWNDATNELERQLLEMEQKYSVLQ